MVDVSERPSNDSAKHGSNLAQPQSFCDACRNLALLMRQTLNHVRLSQREEYINASAVSNTRCYVPKSDSAVSLTRKYKLAFCNWSRLAE
jgi:hypothetical protein